MKEMMKMPKNTKAKYLLEDITFDHEGAHLAYTLGSGAASGKNKAFLFKGEDLAEDNLDEESIEFLKAKKGDVRLDLTFQEFIEKFLHMYGQESRMLCKLMGYDYDNDDENRVMDNESYKRIIDEKLDRIHLIKDMNEDQIALMKSVQIEFEKALKKEGSEKLPASAFAYTPDKEKPSTWKLRIDDATHTRSAVAALGKGMMGNKVQIPSKDLKAVKSKVRAAYKKFYPDNEVPAVLKSLDKNESGLMLDSDNANSGINKNKEPKMTEPTNEELIQKAAEDKVEALLKAKQDDLLKAAKAEWEAEQASIALTKSNTEILKGLDFIAEDQLEAIVKATVVEGGETILKALEEAGKAVELAKAAEAQAKTDLEKFKEEFAETEQVNAEINEQSFKEKLRKAVDTAKANQAK